MFQIICLRQLILNNAKGPLFVCFHVTYVLRVLNCGLKIPNFTALIRRITLKGHFLTYRGLLDLVNARGSPCGLSRGLLPVALTVSKPLILRLWNQCENPPNAHCLWGYCRSFDQFGREGHWLWQQLQVLLRNVSLFLYLLADCFEIARLTVSWLLWGVHCCS